MKTIIKKIAVLLIVSGINIAAQAQNGSGQIKGIILDEEHQPAMNAIVKALQGGIIIKQGVTDMEGRYSLKPLEPGVYEVLITYIGYKTIRFPKVQVDQEKTSYLDADLEINELTGIEVVAVKEWEKPLVDKNYMTMHSLSIDQINTLAVQKGDIKGMIASISSDIYVSDDGLLYSRGARPGASKYFVDGDLLPFDQDVTGMSIQNLSVITGGIPAQYGDVTGAVIVVTTKDYFSGIAQKNMRNRSYQERLKKEREEKEYKEMKKKREEEIEKEKEEEKLNKE